MQAGLYPIVLIVNNASYGTIRMHQERNYPHRVSGTDLQNPDFVGLAQSYGFYGERVGRPINLLRLLSGRCIKNWRHFGFGCRNRSYNTRQSIADLRNAA